MCNTVYTIKDPVFIRTPRFRQYRGAPVNHPILDILLNSCGGKQLFCLRCGKILRGELFFVRIGVEEKVARQRATKHKLKT